MERSATIHEEMSTLIRTRLPLALLLFATVACGGEAEDPSGEDPGVSSELGEDLRSQLRYLPWRGAPATPTQHTSNTPGLSVIYGIDIWFSSGTIRTLDVWWYEPSRADNTYANGDPWGSSRLGPSGLTDVAFMRQTCPTNHVVAGYQIALNQAKTKIIKFGITCRNLFDDDDITHFVPVGSHDPAVIPEILRCGDFPQPPPSGYIEYMFAQTDLSGIGARCVLPR